MEIAFIIDQLKDLKEIKNIDVLYFGNEFCQNKIANIKQLNVAYMFSKTNKMKFVFVLPYITNEKVILVEKLLYFLNDKKENIEIVFNDWGTFTLISKYKNLKPVLGRLLNKQRKDPIAYKILNDTQPKIKIIIENKRQVIVQKKQIPETLKDYFQQTYLDVNHVQKFMIDNNIRRYELDLLPWQTKIKLNTKIKLSVYYPYVNISTTRYCGAINFDYSSKCNKVCSKQKIVVGEKIFDYPYYIFGNSIFYKADAKILNKGLKINKISRIVFNDLKSLFDFKEGK